MVVHREDSMCLQSRSRGDVIPMTQQWENGWLSLVSVQKAGIKEKENLTCQRSGRRKQKGYATLHGIAQK